MNKILVFCAWTVAGLNFASLLAQIPQIFPSTTIPYLAVGIAVSLISLIIGFYSPSSRPWILLGFVVFTCGGLFVWLL